MCSSFSCWKIRTSLAFQNKGHSSLLPLHSAKPLQRSFPAEDNLPAEKHWPQKTNANRCNRTARRHWCAISKWAGAWTLGKRMLAFILQQQGHFPRGKFSSPCGYRVSKFPWNLMFLWKVNTFTAGLALGKLSPRVKMTTARVIPCPQTEREARKARKGKND